MTDNIEILKSIILLNINKGLRESELEFHPKLPNYRVILELQHAIRLDRMKEIYQKCNSYIISECGNYQQELWELYYDVSHYKKLKSKMYGY